MNTWFVGNVPIGHYHYKSPIKEAESTYLGKKVFFMKARIMAGQAALSNNKRDLVDFKWLTKEEIREATEKEYWRAVRHLLVAQ